MKRFLSITRDVFVILLVTLSVIFVIEGLARAFLFVKLGPEGYAVHRCTHDPVFTNLILGESGGMLNSLGFRGPEIKPHKDKNTFRVAVVGGSSVYCVFVDTREAWPAQLEERLREMFPGRKIEVINAGRLGSVAANEVFMVEYLLKFNPDLIIIYGSWNDIYHYRYLPEQYKYVAQWTDKKLSPVSRFTRAVRRIFLIVQKIREWKKAWRNGMKKTQEKAAEEPSPEEGIKQDAQKTAPPQEEKEVRIHFGWQGGHADYPLSSLPPPNADFIPLYRKNLERIAKCLAERKVNALFIFQPDLGYKMAHGGLTKEEEETFAQSVRVFSKDWHTTAQLLYPITIETMRQVAGEWHIPFYDFSLAFNDTSEPAFADTVHLNAYGNREIGGRVAEIIRENKYIKA